MYIPSVYESMGEPVVYQLMLFKRFKDLAEKLTLYLDAKKTRDEIGAVNVVELENLPTLFIRLIRQINMLNSGGQFYSGGNLNQYPMLPEDNLEDALNILLEQLNAKNPI